ncbi:MAG: asparaginase [Candidatus Buchananbacteria bacterium]
MPKATKKIYLIAASVIPGLSRQDILQKMPELNFLAEVEPIFLFDKFSAEITVDDWLKLTQEIIKRKETARGFVILHGLDNLLYTAAVLNFLLPNPFVPIIFTGGQARPDDIKQLEIKANLINAIQAAKSELNEVCLMFGNRLLRASQSVRTYDETLNLFSAPASGILGRIDFSIRIFDKLLTRGKSKKNNPIVLNKNIAIIELTPFLDLKNLAERLNKKQAIIIDASRNQNLPTDLVFFLNKLAADVPVLVWGLKLTPKNLGKNVINVVDLTWEVSVIKFMWLLNQTQKFSEITELMNQNLTGEKLI